MIGGEKLDITKISLAKVTEDFLSYLSEIEEKRPAEMADFLVIATKLLYIKSSLLLPEPEMPEEAGFDLETQLKIYRDFATAAKKVDAIWKKDAQLFMREKPYLVVEPSSFQAPANVTALALHAAFADVIRKLQLFVKLPETEIRRVISLADRMRELENLIRERSEFAFHEILEKAESKGDVVVSFIALLELVKQRVISVEQEASFCDIVVKRQDAETDRP